MERPDFTKLTYSETAEIASDSSTAQPKGQFPEGVKVKSHYSAQDTEGFTHLGFSAGIPPFLRGPYATMYALRPWTKQQQKLATQALHTTKATHKRPAKQQQETPPRQHTQFLT